MSGADPATIWAFVGYLLVVVGIGIAAARFSSGGLGEFFLAGRNLNRVVVALSAVSSGRSSWLLLGFSGMAYSMGAAALWAAVGYIIAEFLLFWTYARRLRRFAGAKDCITVPDFFAERFGEGNGTLRILMVLIFLVFMTPYVGAQFLAGGKAFDAAFSLGRDEGILLTAAIVLVYTMLGGFLAVSLTDVVQACFMLFALVALPVLAILELGGVTSLLDQLGAMDLALVDPLALSAGALIGFVGIGLGSPGSPHIIVRYMAIKNAESLRGAAIIGTVWNVLMAAGALFIGLAARATFPDVVAADGTSAMHFAADTEQAYPGLAFAVLHPILFGMVMASIFAAIMSTADSQLLVAASGVVRDVYEKLVLRGARVSPRRLVMMSRLTILVLCAIGVGVALKGEGIFWLVLYAWAGPGAALGPTSILALYWRGTTRAGAIAGMLAGMVTVIVWAEIDSLDSLVYELVP
ncbi:MAG: sodium/proline symporter, partial [Planctomycetota bacterium]